MKKVTKILLVITLILLIDISYNKAYAASTYKCERGFDLIDDMCKKITNARFRNGYTYCNPGEGTLVGDKCVLEKEPILVDESDDDSYVDNNTGSDNNNDTNEEVETDLVVYPSEYYRCTESGYTLLGSKCMKSTNAYFRNGMYYCNPGTGELKGKECILTKPAELVCPAGYKKVNERCLKYVKNATCKSASASDCWCSENQILIGKECYSDLLDLLNPPKSCPSGYELSGYDCIKYVGSAQYRGGNYFCNGDNQKLVGQSCYYVYKEESNNNNNNNNNNNDNNDDNSKVDGNVCDVIITPAIGEKINWIFNLIKYGGTLLAIMLSMFEFMKAVGSDEDNATKKASERLIKRLIAAAIIFLIPLFLQFIFNTIEIPGIITHDPTCGIGVSN